MKVRYIKPMCSFFYKSGIFPFCMGLLLISCAISAPLLAGDEDVKVEMPKVPPVAEPEIPQVQPEEESPNLSVGEEKSPEFAQELETKSETKKRAKKPWDPDENVDYSELLGLVEPTGGLRGVLAPALGFRGYRPNMLALGYGDRTPGTGALVEYSWNRLGVGAFYSVRRLSKVLEEQSKYQNFAGVYGLYRWLPWSFSPYILLGLEMATNTEDGVGGMAGFGMEVEVYQGWTFLLGYTYHSTVHLGFLGGAIGWSF